MASRSSIFEAKAAARMQSCTLFAENRIGSPSVSWFLVKVPVLSEHRMSTPAISSMADSLETIAFCFDSASAGHELGGAAEERVGAGRDDDALHLALLDDAARIGFVADLLRKPARIRRSAPPGRWRRNRR